MRDLKLNEVDVDLKDCNEKDSVLYMDKSITQCEEVQEIVCYNETNTYHGLKDICIDEGITTHGKFLIDENNTNIEKSEVEELVKMVDTEKETDIADDLEDLNVRSEGKKETTDQIADEISKKIDIISVLPLDQPEAHSYQTELESIPRTDDKIKEHSLVKNESPLNLESVAVPEDKSVSPQTRDRTGETNLSSIPEDRIDGSISDQTRDGVGEMSFSMVPGHIMYSGHIAYNGSLSIRSDGSASNRSFAFPILPSEWTSSPVRMTKADRRRFRKNKSWKETLLCCRF